MKLRGFEGKFRFGGESENSLTYYGDEAGSFYVKSGMNEGVWAIPSLKPHEEYILKGDVRTQAVKSMVMQVEVDIQSTLISDSALEDMKS